MGKSNLGERDKEDKTPLILGNLNYKKIDFNFDITTSFKRLNWEFIIAT